MVNYSLYSQLKHIKNGYQTNILYSKQHIPIAET